MSRIRSIHPDIWFDEQFVTLTTEARLLLLAVGTYSDYANRFPFSMQSIAIGCGWAWDESAWHSLVDGGFVSIDGGMVTINFLYGHSRAYVSKWEATRSAVFERDGYACQYCGSTENLHCDHISPKSRGGSDEMENLTTSCQFCNLSKGAKTLEEWGQA